MDSFLEYAWLWLVPVYKSAYFKSDVAVFIDIKLVEYFTNVLQFVMLEQVRVFHYLNV